MGCFTCSQIEDKYRNVFKYYRNLYKDKGIIHYIYRLNPSDPWKFVKRESFQAIFDNEIKKELINGAEYFDIREFTGD